MSDQRPPKSPRKGKHVYIRIAFLNDTIHVFQVPVKGVGVLLWEAVVNHLQLLEADYFDLEYTNHQGDNCWLDREKNILKQIGSRDTLLRFGVKFYTPDPGLLEDELTRYLFALQVRKDLLHGELRCSENTAALLASYIVQGEIGDFDMDEFRDTSYLAVFSFVPDQMQTPEFMAKVMDYHKQHYGESPSEADLNLLDTARKVEMYGIKMHQAKDHEGVSLNLAVAHMGVLVFQQMTKINTFSWAKVRKISFKRKKFLIKLHADTYDRRLEGTAQTPTKSGRGFYKDTVEFFFESRDRCKLFWKRCIEHHAFFRCQVVAKVPRNKTRVVSRGSSFRYCGRTQKQLVEYVRENISKRPQFERSTSGRISSPSASTTPRFTSKIGMHSSSADLRNNSGSRSSGSHILDSNHTPNSGGGTTREPSTPHRLESADVHSDSSMSGSRSLNSPRLEHGLSLDQDVIEAVNARTGGAMTDDEEEEDISKSDSDQGQERMSHVASDTKGAHSLLSPEMNSPVRYIGIYSEDDTHGYPNHRPASPEAELCPLDNCGEAQVKAPVNLDSAEQQPSSCGGQSAEVAAASICKDTDHMTDSSADVSPAHRMHDSTPRTNLNLQLTNTSSSTTTSALTHDHTVSHHHSITMPPQTTTTALSASQNHSDPSKEPESSELRSGVNSTHTTSFQSDIGVSSSDGNQVSCPPLLEDNAAVVDTSPPFPSPPPPLSPPAVDADMRRDSIISSNSSVMGSNQNHSEQQVRFPSLDSNVNISVLTQNNQSHQTFFSPVVNQEDKNSCQQEDKKIEVPENKEDNSQTKNLDSSGTDHCTSGVDKPEVSMKDHLQAGQGMSRKLSAGTDLIEDIPYILHRRLDDHTEETAVFKVSEADKIKRQRSQSPGSKKNSVMRKSEGDISHVQTSADTGTDTRPEPSAPGTLPRLKESSRNRPSLERSPSLNKRYDLVSIHKLPPRTSYSSVDDTTSPSGDQVLLRQLENESAAKPLVTKSSEANAVQEEVKQDTFLQQVCVEDQSKEAESEMTRGEVNRSDFQDKVEPTHNHHDEVKPLPDHKDEVKQLPDPKDDVKPLADYKDEVKPLPDLKGKVKPLPDPKDEVKPLPDPKDEVKPLSHHKDEVKPLPDHRVEVKPLPDPKDEVKTLTDNKDEGKALHDHQDEGKPLHNHQDEVKPLCAFVESESSSHLEYKNSNPCQSEAATRLSSCDSEAESIHEHQAQPARKISLTSSSSSMDANQFIIDLPSPAAALFYSDNDSPSSMHAEGGTAKTPALTFSTFRPVSEEILRSEGSSVDKKVNNRWSLHSVDECEESSDIQVIMTDAGVERSALKKRLYDDADKPREPKRVSWHGDGNIRHCYSSDEWNPATHIHDMGTAVDSGHILETLENIRQQNSESDMTNSASSDSLSGDSDKEAESSAKRRILQYAVCKGSGHSKEGAVDMNTTEGNRTHGLAGSSESLDNLGSLDVGYICGAKKKAAKPQHDTSPLGPLEHLSGLQGDDFDDEGEADDEDDEPNFPPPPPIMDIPDEMTVSCESDLPFPDLNYAGWNPGAYYEGVDCSLVATSASQRPGAGDGIMYRESTRDPLMSLKFGDLVGDKQCTTSESESDFDAEEATIQMRRMSATSFNPGDLPAAALHHSLSLQQGQSPSADQPPAVELLQSSSRPRVLPKPGPPTNRSTSQAHKPQTLPVQAGPPPVHPKPKIPGSNPRPGPLRQPQMGKGMHFERKKHKSPPDGQAQMPPPHR